MKKESNEYLFYYPSVGIGGAQLLMARTAEYLIKRGKSVKVLVDRKLKTCFIVKYLDSYNYIYKKEYFDKDNKYLGKSNEMLIIPQPSVFRLNNIFQKHSCHRIFQWDTFPSGVQSQLFFSEKSREQNNWILRFFLNILNSNRYRVLKKYIVLSSQKKALAFMCGANFRFNSNIFDLNIDPIYLPLPVQSNGHDFNDISRHTTRKNYLNIAWIGRISKIKSRLIEFVIVDCDRYNKDNNDYCINLFIIGDGDEKVRLLNKYNYSWLEFVGVVPNEKVFKFYKDNNIDIGVNVGTSALEAGLNGLYSILLPGLENMDDFLSKEKRYLSLFDVQDYDVSIRDSNDDNLMSFDSVIQTVINNDINHLKRKSFEYVYENHGSKSVFVKLERLLQSSELYYRDLERMRIFRPIILERLAKLIR